MTSILYAIAILVIGASVIFSYLNTGEHKELTQKTYETRKEIDGLEQQIALFRGSKHKGTVDQIKDKDDLAKTEDKAFKLIFERKISGRVAPLELVSNPTADLPPYERREGDTTFKFVQYNRADVDSAAYKSLHDPATDIIVGKAKELASRDVAAAVSNKLGDIQTVISSLQTEIDQQKDGKRQLESEIAKFVKIEAEIKKEFSSEGVQSLKDGEELYQTLKKRQQERIRELKALNEEQTVHTEKRDNNNAILTSQADYRKKRRVSLGANSKRFPLTAADFSWGFVVIKSDKSTKFFVNQKLMILRGKSHIGDVVVSAVEPGRVMANIDYDSVAAGNSIKRGDVAILAEPADQ